MTLLERLDERWERMDGASATKINRILGERREAAAEIKRLEVANEELIRGMTEIAERYTAAMDRKNARIEELEAKLTASVQA